VILRTETLPTACEGWFSGGLKKILQARIVSSYEQPPDAEKFKKSIEDAQKREIQEIVGAGCQCQLVFRVFPCQGTNMMNNLSAMLNGATAGWPYCYQDNPEGTGFLLLLFLCDYDQLYRADLLAVIKAKEWF